MKGSNPGVMLENPKQNEGIESGRDAEEPETKQKCPNLGTMSENPKQKKGSNMSKGAKIGLCPSLGINTMSETQHCT